MKSRAGKSRSAKNDVVVLTIGHSTRELGDFLQILQAHGVTRLVDVRTIPRSWHNPQFNEETLPSALQMVSIGYQHLAGLGGLRHTHADSPNGAWRNRSFRGYADYMQTTEFEENLQTLLDIAQQDRIAIMCAEAVPWRCHRSLIADALVARGVAVEHIMSATKRQQHTLRPWADVKGTRVTYPPAADSDSAQSPEIPSPSPSPSRPGKRPMTKTFQVGDRVSWNSEAGRVRGVIQKKITSEIKFKSYTVHASKAEPQYLIESEKTAHQAMHKGSALRKLSPRKKASPSKASQRKTKSKATARPARAKSSQ
jgi:hypothetical protein